MSWVVLGDDGHTSSGEFSFATARPDGPPRPAPTRSPPPAARRTSSRADEGPLRAALRWLGLLGASLLLAAVLLTRLTG